MSHLPQNPLRPARLGRWALFAPSFNTEELNVAEDHSEFAITMRGYDRLQVDQRWRA